MRISKFVIAAACVILLNGCVGNKNTGWDRADRILNKIKAPQFPARDFVTGNMVLSGTEKPIADRRLTMR